MPAIASKEGKPSRPHRDVDIFRDEIYRTVRHQKLDSYATATVVGTRKDAERELRRLLRTVDTGEHVDPNRITVGKWLSDWLSAVRGEVAPKSYERYAEVVDGYTSASP